MPFYILNLLFYKKLSLSLFFYHIPDLVVVTLIQTNTYN